MVLVGAGHAHVEVLRSFAATPAPGIQLTLITRARFTPYSGMLPGLIAGVYRFEDAHIDTSLLALAAGAELHQTEAVGLDLTGRRVICRDLPPVTYDVVSFDIGSTPNSISISGAEEHAIPVKPIDGFLNHFESLRRRVLERKCGTRVAVVGAGAAGVELVLSLEHRLQSEAACVGLDPGRLRFVLVSGSADILPTFPLSFRRKFRRVLREREIEVIDGASVTAIASGVLAFDERPPLEADEILWATEAAAPAWLRTTNLQLDPSGFIKVDLTLRAESQEHVFAVGDIAAFGRRELPKSGVYAVRQGPVLCDNVRRLLAQKPLRTYSPQRDALYLISTGRRYAIGTRNGLVVEGNWVWKVKDWLDRRWIRRYTSP